MEHKYTGRELHMLKTLREIYNILVDGNTTRDSLFDQAANIHYLVSPFTVTGPTDTELSALIEADRKAHGWPVKGA